MQTYNWHTLEKFSNKNVKWEKKTLHHMLYKKIKHRINGRIVLGSRNMSCWMKKRERGGEEIMVNVEFYTQQNDLLLRRCIIINKLYYSKFLKRQDGRINQNTQLKVCAWA